MLVQKESKLDGSVIAIKLVSGEELIAYCVENHTNAVKVKQPLNLVMGSTNSAQGNVVFAPWMLSLRQDQIIIFDKNHVLFLAEAGKDAATQYLRATEAKL